MNDQTPRQYRASLLERAAEQLRNAPSMPMIPPVDAPARPVPPVQSIQPHPETIPDLLRAIRSEIEREPLSAYEPLPESIAEPEEVAPPIAAEAVIDVAPMPAFVPPPMRRIGSVDRQALQEGGMIVPGAPVGALAEEFRMVKRHLLLTARSVADADDAKAADRARMILVCSANPNEGKTFCAINLALSMAAERDVEILLVDADFAKPDVLDRLGLPEGPGLLDALSGEVEDVEACIVETDIPQFSVLPAGTRSNSDTELLASDRARALLDGLAQANPRRIVILDSPPALAASPASVLALHVGQVMLVVRADKTNEDDVKEAVTVLDGCEHIQLVLNSVSLQPRARRLGDYYGEPAK